MKKLFALIFSLITLLLCSCNSQTVTKNKIEERPQTKETTAVITADTHNDEAEPIDTIEKLSGVDGVISIIRLEFSVPIDFAAAYRMIYESENGILAADVVLPASYAETKINYDVLIYFPDVKSDPENLAYLFARYGIIVFRPYARGRGESEGMRDLGGNKDLADAKKLLEIIESADFIKDSKIFLAGSAEGSVNALRLFAQDHKKRISGCAVADAITDLTDLHSFQAAHGVTIETLFTALIGKTYEEAPEEYEMRSAVKFSDKLLDRPILMIHYLQNPNMPVEQSDALYELIKDGNCEYHKIDALMSDFRGEGAEILLLWIKKIP